MNKKIILVIIALVVSFIIPFSVNAKEKVNIYVFEGSTCPHCADLKSFLSELEKDDSYKDKFTAQHFEIWHDSDNKELANDVAKAMGDVMNGVPYYVVGNKSFSGFTNANKEEIKNLINSLYEEGYEDPVKDIVEEFNNKPFSWTGILVVAGIIMILGAFIYFAQKE